MTRCMSVDRFEDPPETIRCVNGRLSRVSVMVRVTDSVYDPKSAIPSGGQNMTLSQLRERLSR